MSKTATKRPVGRPKSTTPASTSSRNERVLNGIKAQKAAFKRLRAKYPKDYERFYTEEALARGITPHAAKKARRIKALERELARLKVSEETL